MNRTTGLAVTGMDHLKQSVADILTTPLGSRLARRTYGSLLPDLVDQPDNPLTRLRMYAATASALMRWEPRLRVTRVQLASGPAAGQVTLELTGEHVPTGQTVGLSAALALRGAV